MPTGVGTCLPAGYSPSSIGGAVITATSSKPGTANTLRTVETYVKLTPTYSNLASLGKAIYGSGTVTFSNNADILGNSGPDADIYSGGAFNCTNAMNLAGSLYVQGPTKWTNTCSVQGNLHSLGSITVQNNSSIGGKVISATDLVSLSGNTSVGGVAQAAKAISWSGCTVTKCQANLNPAPAPPPTEPFPIFKWDATTAQIWANQGYTNVVANDNCAGNPNGPTKWIVDNAATLSAPTVLRHKLHLEVRQLRPRTRPEQRPVDCQQGRLLGD